MTDGDGTAPGHVLIASYYFPPLGGSGALRPWHLARELSALGWDVSVLTTTPWTASRRDDDLLSRLPPSVRVERTGSWDPYHLRGGSAPAARAGAAAGGLRSWIARGARLALIPDPTVGWLVPARRAGRRLASARPVDVVISSQPPITSHIVGRSVARAAGAPWIADYRDLWVDCPYGRPPTALHGALYRRLERRWLRDAITVVADNEARAARLRASHPGARVEVIENGFDPDELSSAPPAELARPSLLYLGTVVQGCEVALTSLMDVLARHPTRPHLYLVGNSAPGIDALLGAHAARAGFPDRYHPTGFLPHREALGHVRGATGLVVSGYPDSPFTFSSKVYEYLGSGRPILGVLRRETLPFMASLVDASGGACAPAPDAGALRAALDAVLAAGASPRPVLPPASDSYRWDRLALRFDALLREASFRSGPVPVGARGAGGA